MISNGRDCTSPEWLRAMRAMETQDDHGTTCEAFPVDLEAARLAAFTRVSTDGRTGGDAGEAARAGALSPFRDPASEESLTAIFERLELNPLFQRQAGEH